MTAAAKSEAAQVEFCAKPEEQSGSFRDEYRARLAIRNRQPFFSLRKQKQ